MLENNGAAAKNLLWWILDQSSGTILTMHYFLGGYIHTIPWADTAIHPSVRGATLNLFAHTPAIASRIDQDLPADAGVCYNHYATDHVNRYRTDFESAAWGHNRYRRTEGVY